MHCTRHTLQKELCGRDAVPSTTESEINQNSNIYSCNQQSNTIRTTLICEGTEVLFYDLQLTSTFTISYLTYEHFYRHLSSVNELMLHTLCSHISRSDYRYSYHTLKELSHRLSNLTSPFPCAYQFLLSSSGMWQVHLVFY